jgi:hypothetical protein
MTVNQWELLKPNNLLAGTNITPPPLLAFHHRFIDQVKPYTSTDILTTDVDGDGLVDVACGAWWYQNPTWERFDIPDIYQAIFAYDIDGDSRDELIATRKSASLPDDWYGTSMEDWYHGLSSEFCWLKPLDPVNGLWEQHPIGTGHGNWPHGALVAPVLPGGKLAFMAAYHSVHLGEDHYPQIFEIPSEPSQYPWPVHNLAEIHYGEELIAYDINANGLLDLVAGPYWLENQGDGVFHIHQFAERIKVNQMARLRAADVNGNGLPDIIMGEQDLDFENQVTPLSRLVWFENPGTPCLGIWKMHVIDQLRCPHSLDVADLDGDGELEIVVAEHDAFNPYHSGCRLFVYKKADPQGNTWFRWLVDDRFEHHDGAKVFEIAAGQPAIVSLGWTEPNYVHLWKIKQKPPESETLREVK